MKNSKIVIMTDCFWTDQYRNVSAPSVWLTTLKILSENADSKHDPFYMVKKIMPAITEYKRT